MPAAVDRERLIDAVVAVLTAAGGELQIVNLNKALFYFDLVALRDTGRTYTGANYVALKNGPAVDGVLVDELVKRGIVDQIEERVVLRKGAPLRHLDRAVAAGTWASGTSDRNPGWAAARRVGDGARINLVLAMQQIVDDDPWVDAPLSDAEREAASGH